MKINKLFFMLIILLIPLASSAVSWVDNPVNCPSEDQVNFAGQNCAPDDIFGDASGIAQCYDTSTLTAPSANTTSSANVDDGSFNGGYLANCYATADAAAPFADNSGNYWCDYNTTLYNSPIYRQTTCVGTNSGGGFGVNAQDICRTGRYNCYGDTNCESTSTSVCGGISANTHYSTGTCETDPYTSGTGTCVEDSGFFACDGSILDADGAEWQSGASCGTNTGTYQLSQCVSSSEANCTRQSDYLDCNNGDADNNQLTCNQGSPNDGCEINPGTTTNNSRSIYQSCSTFACQTGWLDCNPNGLPSGDGTNTDGCETQEGATCGINSHGTFNTNQCYTTTGNCTAVGTLNTWLDCDNDDSDANVITCNGGTNGCEVQNNTACTVGSVSGTINMCSGGVGNCVVDNQDIGTTGIAVEWSGTNPMLWLIQYGAGLIANFTGNSGSYWLLDNNANVNMSGNITADTYFGDGSQLTGLASGGLDGNASSICANGEYLDGDGGCINFNSTVTNLETNETTRFGNLINTDCTAGNLVIGIQTDGTVLCATDSDTTYTAGSNLSLSGNIFSIDATALQNWLDTIYQTIGSYLLASDEPNLNVNSSNYWDNLNTQVDLSITESQISDLNHVTNNGITLVEANITDLTHTTPDNSSWNETRGNNIYANIQWGYNMTQPFTDWLNSFLYDYNQTIPANSYTDTQISSVNTTVNIENLGFTQGVHAVDTNESTRFGVLTGTDCSVGSLVIGVQDDGTVLCATDSDSGTGGWTNDSIQTNTTLNVNIQNNANLTINANDSYLFYGGNNQCRTGWNGTCLNTLCNGNLVMSVGCL